MRSSMPIRLGDQFGMEIAIAGSPGWSETGGPWVLPPQGMKKYVWSETVVEGGKPFTSEAFSPSEQYRAIPEHRFGEENPGVRLLHPLQSFIEMPWL